MSNKSLQELTDAMLEDMTVRGYSASRLKKCRIVLRNLQRYCTEKGIGNYSKEVGEQFLTTFPTPSTENEHEKITNIKRFIIALNCMLDGEVWRPAYGKAAEYAKSWYTGIVNDYKLHLLESGKSKKNVDNHLRYTSHFLDLAEQNGCTKLADITPELIYAAFQEAPGKNSFRQHLNAFFKYICRKKLIDKNFSTILPKSPRNSPVPTVYQPIEVEELLASINRETQLGKRNYAIVLIAARLGLRACDIANITFDCLHNDVIKIIQVKTNRLITLPLLPEIKEAIDDYVNNARPKVEESHIFLQRYGHGVVTADDVSAIARKVFKQSDIDTSDRKSGSHSLRSSLATALLNEGNDFKTIQQALGHVNIQNTKAYARADIEKLRVCAISVPDAIGEFANFLVEGAII